MINAISQDSIKAGSHFIAVEGSDGTGKTTFIEGLVRCIAINNDLKSHVYHFRPTLLPNLGALGEKAGVMKEDKDFTNPHRAKPVSRLSSFVRMTYYWLDYVIGVPKIIEANRKLNDLTIFDRYIYDFLIDPYRSRINLPYWLRELFSKLVMQPKIVFVLLADEEIIYSRKQELTLEEIRRQSGELKRLSKRSKRFVVIDASQTPQEMVDQALKIVEDRF